MLQQILLAHLNQIPGVWVWRANTGVARVEGRTVRFGLTGQADILGLVCGRFLAIEVKAPRGKQRPEQLHFEAQVTKHGGIYLLARDFASTLRAVATVAGVPEFPIPTLAP
jgi:hypothetical protein